PKRCIRFPDRSRLSVWQERGDTRVNAPTECGRRGSLGPARTGRPVPPFLSCCLRNLSGRSEYYEGPVPCHMIGTAQPPSPPGSAILATTFEPRWMKSSGDWRRSIERRLFSAIWRVRPGKKLLASLAWRKGSWRAAWQGGEVFWPSV